MSKTVPQFAEGELVNVTIRGARFSGAEPHLGMHGFDVDGKDRRVWLPLDIPAVTVTRVAPAEWPPQLGDIWSDRDEREWAAGATDGETIVMWRIGDGRGGVDALDVLYDHGPLRLVRRRGWTPATDTAPAASEPEQADQRAEYIKGLRAFADLLESRPNLPLEYPGEVSWLVASKDEVAQWAQVLGRSQDSHDGDGAIHHWAKGALAGLSLRAAWIEDLPPAAEPLPHRVPAEVLEISRNIELVEPDTRLSLDEALADAFPGPKATDCDDACEDERVAAGTCRHTDGW